ncbi:MAG: phosphonate C-P lyase system protein PhnG [Sarcina sp.]
MERNRRTEILINGRAEVLEHISNHIKSVHKIDVIEEPELGLTMLKVREYGKGEVFYIGEMLMTEAKVYVDGEIGTGLIQGENFKKSLELAVVDGAYNLGSKECELFEEILLREEERINILEENRKNQILKTKVDFSTMEV